MTRKARSSNPSSNLPEGVVPDADLVAEPSVAEAPTRKRGRAKPAADIDLATPAIDEAAMRAEVERTQAEIELSDLMRSEIAPLMYDDEAARRDIKAQSEPLRAYLAPRFLELERASKYALTSARTHAARISAGTTIAIAVISLAEEACRFVWDAAKSQQSPVGFWAEASANARWLRGYTVPDVFALRDLAAMMNADASALTISIDPERVDRANLPDALAALGEVALALHSEIAFRSGDAMRRNRAAPLDSCFFVASVAGAFLALVAALSQGGVALVDAHAPASQRYRFTEVLRTLPARLDLYGQARGGSKQPKPTPSVKAAVASVRSWMQACVNHAKKPGQ